VVVTPGLACLVELSGEQEMRRLIAAVLLASLALAGQAGNAFATDSVGACTVGLMLSLGRSCEIQDEEVSASSANKMYLGFPLARNPILVGRELAIKLFGHPDIPDHNPNARTGAARFALRSNGCPGEITVYCRTIKQWPIGLGAISSKEIRAGGRLCIYGHFEMGDFKATELSDTSSLANRRRTAIGLSAI